MVHDVLLLVTVLDNTDQVIYLFVKLPWLQDGKVLLLVKVMFMLNRKALNINLQLDPIGDQITFYRYNLFITFY